MREDLQENSQGIDFLRMQHWVFSLLDLNSLQKYSINPFPLGLLMQINRSTKMAHTREA